MDAAIIIVQIFYFPIVIGLCRYNVCRQAPLPPHRTQITQNETVSLGDTAVSLQTLIPTMFGRGGGYSWVLKTQSAKSWPNFHFRGGGILGYSKLKAQSAKSWPNFHFRGGGILGYSKLKVPSPDQIFHWGLGPRIGYSLQNEQTICHAKLWKPLHLSHTMYVWLKITA